MLKKQHILLGALFLGMSIKPMEKPGLMAVGGAAVCVAVGFSYKKVFDLGKMQKRLLEDKGPYEDIVNIYAGITEKKEIKIKPFNRDEFIKEHGGEGNLSEEDKVTLLFWESNENGFGALCPDIAYDGIRTWNKEESHIPFWGITGESEDTCTRLLEKLHRRIIESSTPSKWNILMGKTEYSPLNNNQIKSIIEENNNKNNKSHFKDVEFASNYICGWLTDSEGGKFQPRSRTLHVARCVEKYHENDGLTVEAWFGDIEKACCRPLFDNKKIGSQIVFGKISDKNSFLVMALCYVTGKNTEKNCGEKLVFNIREMIKNQTKNQTIEKIETNNCQGCFEGIPIKEGTMGVGNETGMAAVTVVTFNNDDD